MAGNAVADAPAKAPRTLKAIVDSVGKDTLGGAVADLRELSGALLKLTCAGGFPEEGACFQALDTLLAEAASASSMASRLFPAPGSPTISASRRCSCSHSSSRWSSTFLPTNVLRAPVPSKLLVINDSVVGTVGVRSAS